MFPMSVRDCLQIGVVDISADGSNAAQNHQELLLLLRPATTGAHFLDPYCWPALLEMHHPLRVRVVLLKP